MAKHLIADRHYVSPLTGADWTVNAYDLVQVHLTLALSEHVANWAGATDDELFEVAKAVVDALDSTPRGKVEG